MKKIIVSIVVMMMVVLTGCGKDEVKMPAEKFVVGEVGDNFFYSKSEKVLTYVETYYDYSTGEKKEGTEVTKKRSLNLPKDLLPEDCNVREGDIVIIEEVESGFNVLEVRLVYAYDGEATLTNGVSILRVGADVSGDSRLEGAPKGTEVYVSYTPDGVPGIYGVK